MAKKSPEQQIAEKRIDEAHRTGAVELSLGGLGLTSLPDSIGRLSKLETLDLLDNKLTALPESIGQLSQLRRLDLGGNQLTTLPDSIGQLSLGYNERRVLYYITDRGSMSISSISERFNLREKTVEEIFFQLMRSRLLFDDSQLLLGKPRD